MSSLLPSRPAPRARPPLLARGLVPVALLAAVSASASVGLSAHSATAATRPAAAAVAGAAVPGSEVAGAAAAEVAGAAVTGARVESVRPGSGVWPLDPRPVVLERFAPPAVRWGRGHRGVDLAGRAAQTVRASVAGRVTYAGRLAGRGVVVVDHGGTRTTYEPVTASVRVGDRVSAGSRLGRLELFGSHCFPRWCLHWGLIEGRDHYLDPLLLVGAAPVVLLPLSGVPVATLADRRPSAPVGPWTGPAVATAAAPPVGGSAARPVSGSVAWPVVGAAGWPPAEAVARPLGPLQARGWAWR